MTEFHRISTKLHFVKFVTIFATQHAKSNWITFGDFNLNWTALNRTECGSTCNNKFGSDIICRLIQAKEFYAIKRLFWTFFRCRWLCVRFVTGHMQQCQPYVLIPCSASVHYTAKLLLVQAFLYAESISSDCLKVWKKGIAKKVLSKCNIHLQFDQVLLLRCHISLKLVCYWDCRRACQISQKRISVKFVFVAKTNFKSSIAAGLKSIHTLLLNETAWRIVKFCEFFFLLFVVRFGAIVLIKLLSNDFTVNSTNSENKRMNFGIRLWRLIWRKNPFRRYVPSAYFITIWIFLGAFERQQNQHRTRKKCNIFFLLRHRIRTCLLTKSPWQTDKLFTFCRRVVCVPLVLFRRCGILSINSHIAQTKRYSENRSKPHTHIHTHNWENSNANIHCVTLKA